MLIDGRQFRSIWRDVSDNTVKVIDQRLLPHELKIVDIGSPQTCSKIIKEMYVRGAPLIGVTAAYGFAIAMQEDDTLPAIEKTYELLVQSRPTAVNLKWACDRFASHMKACAQKDRAKHAFELADLMAEEDVASNCSIGSFGYEIIKKISSKKRNPGPVRILTHCNAGWLATVDRGTATAPIYEAVDKGIDVEVWVDETRPRNQGAFLTTWELTHNNVKNTLVVDNAGGHLMQKGLVDLVIVGSDRTTVNGDVCNKIGTYLKALAAKDNNVPFYAAMPTSTIDFEMENGSSVPIEERSHEEVLQIRGKTSNGSLETISIAAEPVSAANPAFDITPAKYVTGIITDKGIVNPIREEIISLRS